MLIIKHTNACRSQKKICYTFACVLLFKIVPVVFGYLNSSQPNAPAIVFLTVSVTWNANVFLSVLYCISSFLLFFPAHRSSSAGPHTRGRVCTFFFFSITLRCVVLPRVFIRCTCLSTKDNVGGKLLSLSFLLPFVSPLCTRDKHGRRVSFPQTCLPARPQRWQPLLSRREEQRRADSRGPLPLSLYFSGFKNNSSCSSVEVGSVYGFPVVIFALLLKQKLPFTIPELVQASPCRSSDGVLYMGKAASQTGVAPVESNAIIRLPPILQQSTSGCAHLSPSHTCPFNPSICG